MRTTLRHFLSLSDAGGDGLAMMLNDALDRKAARAGKPKGVYDDDAPLAGHVLAMLFEAPSTRTRVSFDMAMRQLGGTTIMLDSATTQLGRGEPISDTAQILSSYCDALLLRTDAHQKLVDLAQYSSVPVVNGLTAFSHPCQVVADLLTVIEEGKALPGLQVAWLGDGNNMCNSWIEAAGLMKFTLRVATPKGYEPDAATVAAAQAAGGEIILTTDAEAALRGADVVVTDCWVSMAQEGSGSKVIAMRPYQVNSYAMSLAKSDAIFLHCLPAHRGEEVTEEVIDGPQSCVLAEAENRLHAQKSVLLWALGKLV